MGIGKCSAHAVSEPKPRGDTLGAVAWWRRWTLSPSSMSETSRGADAPIQPARRENTVLPHFEDSLERPPRVWLPRTGVWGQTKYLMSGLLPGARRVPRELPKQSESGSSVPHLHKLHEQTMPRMYRLLGNTRLAHLRGYRQASKIVVIGVHGWYAQSILKNIIGVPIGTSALFASMMSESIRRKYEEAGVHLSPDAITEIAIQHDGCVRDRADAFLAAIAQNAKWVNALREAEAVFVVAHSQGAIVSTFLLAHLLDKGLVNPERARLCQLTMCGIFQGPFLHVKNSMTSSYLSYFETDAARELFDFQASDSVVSIAHRAAYRRILAAGVKCVHIGSVDDNVVPLYSALFSCAAHPSILRAVYVDGIAFPQKDFLIMLIALCVLIRNCGFHDHNLLTLLSASVAGPLYTGQGHTNLYLEPRVYDMATQYLFETYSPKSSGASEVPLVGMPYAPQRWNSYELPWSLRGLLEDSVIRHFFMKDIRIMIRDYAAWTPTSKKLKDLQRRLAPMSTVRVPTEPSDMKDEPSDADEDDPFLPAMVLHPRAKL